MSSRRWIRSSAAVGAAALAALAASPAAWPAHWAGGSVPAPKPPRPVTQGYPLSPILAATAVGGHTKGSTIRSCSAHRIHVGKRTFLPVACEQPPKSNLGLQLQQRSAANAATLLGS